MPQDNQAALLSVRDLSVSFANRGGPRLQAVEGASFTLYPGQTLAVVGESGCGKSVTAMSLLRLVPSPPSRIDRGSAAFRAASGLVDLLSLPDAGIRHIRGNEIAMIFQEPMSSLNPVFTIGEQVVEAIRLHQRAGAGEARDIALAAMAEVGIPEPARRVRQYPHQFSGGMRQRVMIAMALACRPRLLLADEPTTALDASIQAQILALLRGLKQSRGMSILLITHDLGVVAQNADAVCVMYAGRVVEYASVFDLFARPVHPYTRGLLRSIPRLGGRRDRLTTIREVMQTPGELDRLPGEPDLKPWWPWTPAPRDVEHDAKGMDSALVPVGKNHWAGVWRTPPAAARAPGAPDLAFIRPPPGGTEARCAS